MSKINVIEVTTSIALDQHTKRKLTEMLNDKWVNSNEIEWFDTKSIERKTKLEKVLS